MKIRPWHRLRYWALAAALLIASTIVWVVLETRRVQHGQPNVAVDYRAQFREDVARHVDLGPDHGAEAWRVMINMLSDAEIELAAFNEALEARGDFQPRYEYDDPSADFYYPVSGRTIPVDADRERDAIEHLRQRGILEQLSHFAELAPGYNPDVPTQMLFAELLPYLRQARQVAMMRTASMRFAQAEGDFSEVADGLNDTLALAQTIALQPMLINSLVGLAIQALVLSELRHQLMESEFDASSCRAMLGSLDRFEFPPTELALAGERASQRDALQHLFTDNGRGNGYLLTDPDSWNQRQLSFPEAFLSRFVFADRLETQQAFDVVYERSLIELQRPIQERWTSLEYDEFVDALSWKLEFVKTMIPSVDRAAAQITASRADREGTRLMIALAKFRAIHGRYPTALDELAPDILPEPPVDFLHGGPYGYRLLEDDEHGRPYLLYSFGLDGEDNNGAEAANETAPLRSRENGDGFDRVFNKPRAESTYE